MRPQRISSTEGVSSSYASLIYRVLKLSFSQKIHLFIAIIAVILGAALQLMIPGLLGQAVDQASRFFQSAQSGAGSSLEDLYWTAFLLFAFSSTRGIFAFVHSFLGEAIGQNMGYLLRMQYFEQLQKLSFSYHDRVHTGDLITLGILDIEGVRMFINTGLLRMFFLLTLVGGGFFLMLRTNVFLGLVSLSFVPFIVWRGTAASLGLRKNWLQIQEKLSVLTKVMDENLNGIRVVRAFCSQPYELDKYDKASLEALRLFDKQISIKVTNDSVMSFVFLSALGLVIWFGGQKVLTNEISLGTLTVLLAFMSILQQPVRQIGMLVNSFSRAASCGERLFSILDRRDYMQEDDSNSEVNELGSLEFENVSFKYPGEKQPLILDRINLKVVPGQTLGIIGPQGSGKSTLAQLISRFYDPTTGSIRFNGKDLRNYGLQSLRRSFSIVQQDTFLFTSTIGNNILYGDPWAEENRIIDAASRAQLHEHIDHLPSHYNTMIGERGLALSGGQRQRLNISRSLILDSKILIFDDSTSAIDAATEQKIRENLKEGAAGRITLIISHRLASLMHADQIVYLENGAILERGNHDELMELNGHYARLYRLQTAF